MAIGLRKLVESEGIQTVERKLTEMAAKKKFRLGDEITLKELFDGLVGIENLPSSSRSGGFIQTRALSEAAVQVSAFSRITGVLLGNIIIEAYQLASGLADKLTGTYKTKLRDERIPGFMSHAVVKETKEGDAYDEGGFSDKYVGPGTAVKMGKIINITEEAVYFDQTGMVLEHARGIGERAAQDRELTVIKAVTGATTSYYPNGTGTALYGAAPYLKASNALVDWTSIEAAITDGLAAMVDEEGNAIIVIPKVVLVPTALEFTARRIINAIQILSKTPTSGTAGTTAQARETVSANPVPSLEILSSPLVYSATSSATTWFIGDPQRQFRWREIWPLQVFERSANTDVQFERDIVAGYKVRYYGNVFAMDQKYVVKCTA